MFTCVLNSNIRSDDVQWYRFIKDTSTTEMIDPNGDNINFLTSTIGSTTSSSLTITNAINSYTRYFWVGTPSLNGCNSSLTVLSSMYVCTYVHTYIYVYVYVCVATYVYNIKCCSRFFFYVHFVAMGHNSNCFSCTNITTAPSNLKLYYL